MPLSLENIQKKIKCELFLGQGPSEFEGITPLTHSHEKTLSFLAQEKYLEDALKCKAGGLLCSKEHSIKLKPAFSGHLIICENPYAAFAKVAQHFFKPQHPFSGHSDKSYIDISATLDPSCTIFPFVFVGPGARIGKNTIVYPGCFIGAGCSIGDDCILYPNSTVREGCSLADRCILNPGAVIGADGFGFAPTADENVKIPHLGGVEIASDVEIGANSTIDRGTLEFTVIGRQTKIDNLVMVGHNVRVGEFCFIAGQTGIAGSATIGNRCVLAGQVGISGHIKVGDNTTVAAQSGVSKNLPSGEIWQGTPARPQKEYAKNYVVLNRILKAHISNKKEGE